MASGHVPLHMAVSPSSGVSQPTHTQPPLSRQDALALDMVATNSGLDHPSVVPHWVEAVRADAQSSPPKRSSAAALYHMPTSFGPSRSSFPYREGLVHKVKQGLSSPQPSQAARVGGPGEWLDQLAGQCHIQS